MVDIATIGIRADTPDLKRGERDLERFAGTGERTEQRMGRLGLTRMTGSG